MSDIGTLQEVLVECNTSKGMFENEVAVMIEANDRNVSFFADLSLISKNENIDSLRAYSTCAEDPKSGQLVRVLLPTETFETGSRWIDVASQKVRPL